MRLAARQVITAAVFEMQVGECDLDAWFAVVGRGPGLLVLDGVIAVDARVGDRTATELVGAGDLLQRCVRAPEEILEHVASWRTLQPARMAVLDDGFAERARPWPQITQALLRRVGNRAADLDVLRAIASQPRLEVRLVLVLWHFAARWGRVEHGRHPPLPAAHAPAAGPDRRRRAAVGLARAGAPVARRPRHRHAPTTCTCTAASSTISGISWSDAPSHSSTPTTTSGNRGSNAPMPSREFAPQPAAHRAAARSTSSG